MTPTVGYSNHLLTTLILDNGSGDQPFPSAATDGEEITLANKTQIEMTVILQGTGVLNDTAALWGYRADLDHWELIKILNTAAIDLDDFSGNALRIPQVATAFTPAPLWRDVWSRVAISSSASGAPGTYSAWIDFDVA